MTPHEHDALNHRMHRLNRLKENLERAEMVLRGLQHGSDACEQHEEVAGRLTGEKVRTTTLTGFQVRDETRRYDLEIGELPEETQRLLRATVRSLVRQLRAQYEAS